MDYKLWEDAGFGINGQEQPVQKNRGFFDALSDFASGTWANTSSMMDSTDLHKLREELLHPVAGTTPEEYEALKQQYRDLYNEQQQTRLAGQQAQNRLKQDGRIGEFAAYATNLGGSLPSIGLNLIGHATGTYKITNPLSSYMDAESAAIESSEKVLSEGGTLEQAEMAFRNALPKQIATTIPDTIVDQMIWGGMGEKLGVGKNAINIAKKFASKLKDPATRIGSEIAFKTGKKLLGKGAGALTDTFANVLSENVQEGSQNYVSDVEAARAMGQDVDYSLGDFKDSIFSKEGIETIKGTTAPTLLTSLLGGAIKSNQYLSRGAETNVGIKTHNAFNGMQNEKGIKLNPQARAEQEMILSKLRGFSREELASWSDADIVAESAVAMGDMRKNITGEESDISQIREAVDTVARLSKDQNSITKEGEITEDTRDLLTRMGLDEKDINDWFTSPTDVLAKARQVEQEEQAKQKQTEQEGEKPKTTMKVSPETGETLNVKQGEVVQGQKPTEQTTDTQEPITEKTTQNGLGEQAKQAEQQGTIQQDEEIEYPDSIIGWERDYDADNRDGVEYEGATYYSLKDNSISARIEPVGNGFTVIKVDEKGNATSDAQKKNFPSLKAAIDYLQKNKGETVFQGSDEQAQTELPSDGVNADAGNSGTLVGSVEDLYNLSQQEPDLLNPYEFAEFVRIKQHMGAGDLDVYFDRRKGYTLGEDGQWHEVNASATPAATAKGRAIIQLYKGGDLGSAIHEIAHTAYWKLSDADKRTFGYYAIKTQGKYIADSLDEDYTPEFENRLLKLASKVSKNVELDEQDKQLQEKILSKAATNQIYDNLITFYNSKMNGGAVDLKNLTSQQQRAIEERWAWEMSQWYIEGYSVGVAPSNIIQRIAQRGCESIAKDLNSLARIWQHIHHKDNNEIENIYRGGQSEEQKQLQKIQFTNEFERQAMPNVNMPMNFGGEQAIQYGVPTLGESYDAALQKERKASAAKNKREAQKLLKIVEERKSGWEKALERLAYVDPKRFRSVKVQDGNDLWSGQEEQGQKQQEENIPNIDFTNEFDRLNVPNVNMPMGFGGQEAIDSTLPNVQTPMNFGGQQAIEYNVPTLGKSYDNAKQESQKQSELKKEKENIRKEIKELVSMLRNKSKAHDLTLKSTGIHSLMIKYHANGGRGIASYLKTLQKLDKKIQEMREEQKKQELENARNNIKNKFDKADELFKKDPLSKDLSDILKEIGFDIQQYGIIKAFSGSEQDNKFFELFNEKHDVLSKEIEKIRKQKAEEENPTKQENKIKYVDKNFKGVKGLSDSAKLVAYDTFKKLSTGGDMTKSLAKENAVLYARICERLAKIYNQNDNSNSYDAQYIANNVDVEMSTLQYGGVAMGSFIRRENRRDGKLLNVIDRVIKIYKGARHTTFLHETAHMFDVELELIATKFPNSEVAKDWNTLKEWAEYKGKEEEEAYANSLGRLSSITQGHIDNIESASTDYLKGEKLRYFRQEKLAQGFEEYLRSGQAPTSALKEIFQKFKDFVKTLFKDFELLGMKPSPEVRAVFDKMIMTDEEIEQKKQQEQKEQKVQKEEEQAKPTIDTNEIYSHLYFGDKTGKLKYNPKTKKIEYFAEEYVGRNPNTMSKMYKVVLKGEITPEQYNELRQRYEQDFKKAKGEKKENAPDLVEGMKKEDFMYSAYKETKQSKKEIDEFGEGNTELGYEKKGLVTDKKDESGIKEKRFDDAIKGKSYFGEMGETELTEEQKKEAKDSVEEEPPKVEKKKTEKQTKTKETKKTTSKPKTTDYLSALHKKYKYVTGTPIGEKGYRFKDDEKAFIEGFKGMIDGAIGNKEELVNVAKRLDSWFQNDPTERNRMVRKYLSQYLADAAKINAKQDTNANNQISNEAQEAQDILDKAFPNTRFQYAWHSTPHNFSEFTLKHLLEGEGAMAHGWGLYFGLNVQKNKVRYFDRLGKPHYAYGIRPAKIFVKGKNITKAVEKFYFDLVHSKNNNKFIKDLHNHYNTYLSELDTIKKGIQSGKFYNKDFPGTYFFDGSTYWEAFDGQLIKKSEINDYIQDLEKRVKLGEKIIQMIDNDGVDIVRKPEENKNKFLFVDIPNDDVLLKEGMGFEDQPPKVQRALMKLVRTEGLLNGEEDSLSNEDLMEHFDDILGVNIDDYDGDIYGTLSWMLEDDPYGITDEDTTDQGKERCSKLLNQYGIKGIRYKGRMDGECAVIFDDKAIDIITKFKQEQGKWKSEKVDNKRNREVDKQKAQRKLEKHRANQISNEAQEGQDRLNKAFPNTRFQFAYHGTKYDFDKFTLEHLGEGQGQAVAGWGLYFTKHQDVAKAYHDYLSKGDERGQVVLVDIPEDDKLLHELKPFKEHPKHIQVKIAQAFRDAQMEIIDNIKKQKISSSDKRMYISEVKNYLLRIDHNDFDTIGFGFYESLVDAYDYTFMNQGYSKSYRKYKSKELASKVLNKNGIEGISYYGKDSGAKRGLKDRESFVIFNDKAIKILDRIKKVNGEWTSEKGDNSDVNQRDIDLAQSKLEKHRAKQNNSRYQLHSEEGMEKADTNSPAFKNWFKGSILKNKDGSPKVMYRGIDQHYNPEFDKEEGGIVWITDDIEHAKSYRDSYLDTEPTFSTADKKKYEQTGIKEYTGKPSMQRMFVEEGSRQQEGDLLEAYANIKNPFNMGIVNDKKSPHDTYVDIGKQLKKDVQNGIITEQQMRQVLEDLSYLNKKDKNGNYSTRAVEVTTHFAKKKFWGAFKNVGYDSVKGTENGINNTEGKNVYGVFDKGNVKSIYNNGTFDKNNKDVRYQLASEKGRPLANINTQKFKNWFGNSTAINTDGTPKVFYRGQEGRYDPNYKFDKTDANRNKLTWVAQTKEFVKRGAYNGTDGKGDLWEVYIRTENPFNMGQIDYLEGAEKNPKQLYEHVIKKLEREVKYRRITKKQLEQTKEKLSYLREGKRSDGVVQEEGSAIYYFLDKDTKLVGALKDLGYDSILGIEDGTNTFALFSPNQVKSIYNNGDFDNNNNDIRYQKSDENQEKKLTKKQEKKLEIQKEIKEAKEKGQTTDTYKDVYSVSFTKSAQESKVNQEKMKYFDERKSAWERHEADGRVTYTRTTPFEHHQKVITYNGINDKIVEKKPKKKYREWLDFIKEKITKNLFNDQYALYKLVTDMGLGDTYMRMIVTQGYVHKTGVALEKGIKYNGKRTRGLNEIAREIGEEKQPAFCEYAIAKHLQDIYNRPKNKIEQKYNKDEVDAVIKRVEASEDYELFERCRKDLVEYNHAVFHVLLDGGIITEQEFQKYIERDKNYVPLAKLMDKEDFGFNSIQYARSMINVGSPIKTLGSSKREIKNIFAEMQKRTAIYYAAASRNKAGQIFVNEICNNLDKMYNGDTVSRGASVIRKVKVKTEDGKLITRPDADKQIFYINNGGKHEFYQVSDPEIYRALRHLDEEQLHIINGMLEKILSAPASLIRATATSTPDFGIRNLIRDNLTAFYTSEHGFIPLVDALWGMREIKRNGEFYQKYIDQVGDYGLKGRGKLLKNNTYKPTDYRENLKDEIKKNYDILVDSKRSLKDRTNALLKMTIGAPFFAAGKQIETFNMYLEQGTRVGEFKNAKMGYNGLIDRITSDLAVDIKNTRQSDIISAYKAQDVTLYFAQHGLLGGKFNRFVTFLNASLLGAQKFLNAVDLAVTGKNSMNQKNTRLQKEILFKVALNTAFAIGLSVAGHGDEDYDEAPEYEKDTFWIFPDGFRLSKDEIYGRTVGTAIQRAIDQYYKEGKIDVLKTFGAIASVFKPSTIMPAVLDMFYGAIYNKDSFTGREIVPEYMMHKVGYQQKDIYTGNFAADFTEVLYKAFGINLSAKRVDWALQKNLTNAKKYIDSVYDIKEKYTDPEHFNEKMARGYDKNDSTGKFIGGLRDDVPPVLNLITGTFATNRSQYQSISDFEKKYYEIKQIADNDKDIPMTPEQRRKWKKYQDAYKQYTKLRKQLKAIRSNASLNKTEKREKAQPIFEKQKALAKWAEG